MKVMIIDDEKAMHYILKKMLAKIPNIEVVGAFQDTQSASLFMKENTVHLAFVDISMPNESGMLFAKRMAEEKNDLSIVFVTSHKDYALDAFDVFALDYIVKPVSIERLEKAVERVKAIQQFTNQTTFKKTDANQLCIYCFGGLEVRSTLGTVKWISRKSAELFGYLLFHESRMVSRTQIIDDLFYGKEEKAANQYLNTIVFQLRKSLEPHGFKSCLKSNKDVYSLEMENTFIDFVDFEKRLKQFSTINEENLDRALELESLYTGHLFGERDYLWALNDRERLLKNYIHFAKKIVKVYLLNDENYHLAPNLLHKILGYDEFDEEIIYLLLKGYALQKDKDSLKKSFQRFEKTLKKELRIAPSNELYTHYKNLLAMMDT